MSKTFKRPVSTIGANRITGVYKATLWKWGSQGKIAMYREGERGDRIFDADELEALAPHLKKKQMRGFSIFPTDWKWSPKAKKKPK